VDESVTGSVNSSRDGHALDVILAIDQGTAGTTALVVDEEVRVLGGRADVCGVSSSGSVWAATVVL